MNVNLKGLIGKLNDPTRNALEAAAGFCLARTHYDIEIEHFLLKLLDSPDGDLPRILKHTGVNASRLSADLTRGLDRLKSGNARTPAFSPSLVRMFSEAWTIGSLEFASAQVRTGFTVLAIASTDELARMIRETTSEFQKINPEILRKDFWTIVAGSPEDGVTASALTGLAKGVAPAPNSGKTPNVD